MAGGTLTNRLAANTADNVFHAVTALLAFGAIGMARQFKGGANG